MLEVLFSSLGYAGGVAIDKIILGRYRVPVMRFIPLLFIFLTLITAVFLPVWGSANLELAHQWRYAGLFIVMVAVAIAWNVFYYQGIQKENLAEFELIMLFSPLATIIFAEIFVPDERSLSVFVAGIISSTALIASRFRRHHIEISFAAKKSIIAMLLMSFESILIKDLLAAYSPVTLYCARTAVLALFFVIFYKPKLLAIPRDAFALVIVSAIFGVMQMVLKFYGFQNLGVIETTMVLLLGPFFVYLFCYLYFKEKFYKRDILAMAMTVACILYIEFWR